MKILFTLKLKERITTVKHNSIFIVFLIYYNIIGYMFRLLFESPSGPQDVDPDIQTFSALWDPQLLESKMCTL